MYLSIHFLTVPKKCVPIGRCTFAKRNWSCEQASFLRVMVYPINTQVFSSLGHIENDLCSLIFHKCSVMRLGISEDQWERCEKGIRDLECSLFMIGFEPVLNHSSEREGL